MSTFLIIAVIIVIGWDVSVILSTLQDILKELKKLNNRPSSPDEDSD